MKETICIDGKINTLLDLPSICPYCGTGIHPDSLDAISNSIKYKGIDHTIACVILKCPVCSLIFFAEYDLNISTHQWRLPLVLPAPKPSLEIPNKINEYYPDFYSIYEQAAIAESNKLDDICGAGYRRAIEFLIKHYLMDILPEEKDAILKETLMQSINRIESNRIKVLATAATWLGNDQTHILSKHPDYKIEDIKSFTVAICYFIISEKEFDKAAKVPKK